MTRARIIGGAILTALITAGWFAGRRLLYWLTPELYRVSPHREDRVALVLEPLFFRLESERRALLSATLAELKRRS